MKDIKHIFFDLDNTLWDYRKNASIMLEQIYNEFELEEKHGHSFKEFYSTYYPINEELWERYRNDEVTKEELRLLRFTETFKKLGIQNQDFVTELEQQFFDRVLQNNYLVEGAVEVLDYLKSKGYHLHILTNGFKDFTTQKINDSDLKGYFLTVSNAEELGASKPSPLAFNGAMSSAKAAIEDSVYIGDDWVADMVGATNIGMRAIFFNPLNENHMWIEDVPIIDKLVELKEYF